MQNRREKRVCYRFKIPGAEGKYKKTGFLKLFNDFVVAPSLLDVSKGGLAFVCEDEFEKGQKLIVQLVPPEEMSITLHSHVRRVSSILNTTHNKISVQFIPFGKRSGSNPIEALDILRRLEVKYFERSEN